MPTVYANTTDGKVETGPHSTWTAARDATSGLANRSAQNDSAAVGSSAVAARGGGINFRVKRAFFEFNFTGVTNVDTATLKIKNPGSAASSVRIVKAGNFAPLASGDFDNIVGFSSGNNMAGNVTDYIDTNVTIAANTTTSITLNGRAILDMNSNDKFLIAIVGYAYDYRNVTPSSGDTNVGGITFADAPGTSNDPQIEYTETSGGGERVGQAGGEFTREELRTKQLVSTLIEADTDYEFKFKNNLKSQVYFTMESAKPYKIFESASIRTEVSDSGSNAIGIIQGAANASVIIMPESTASFFMSSSEEISGNSISAIATNPQVLDINNTDTGSVYGIDMEILS